MDKGKDRRQDELSYQADRARRIAHLEPTPDHQIERFGRAKLWWIFPKECVFRSMKGISGKRILDFGCGEGEISTQLARLGASVTGIDISPDLIAVAEKRADLDKVTERVKFLVRDIEESPLAAQQFDIALCYAVLHHLDVRSVFPRLLSALRLGGMVIIHEPVALSPTLQKIRNKLPIPKEGGPLDRPLTKDDLGYLTSNLLEARITFFDMFARLRRLLPNRCRTAHFPWEKTVDIVLGAFDRILLTICPPLSRFCGNIVIVGRKPAEELPTSGFLRGIK